MAGFRVEGNTSGNVAEVTVNNELKVALGNTPATSGMARFFSENDPGTITGSPYLKSPETSTDFRIRAGLDTILFQDTFNATTQNTAKWRYVFTTMTTTQASGCFTMNANSTATATTGTALQSWRYFSLVGAAGLWVEAAVSATGQPLANQVFETGLFAVASATAAPTEGVYLRYTSAGIVGCINFNGTETTTGVLRLPSAIADNQFYQFSIGIFEREVEFWLDDEFLGEIAIPSGNGQPFMTDALPISFVQRNSATVSGAPQMQVRVANCVVHLADIPANKNWAEVQAGSGLAYQGLNGGTMGSLALYTNSLAAGAGAAMTNTTAALGTGLGGQFSALPTLAAGTDGIVCSYQNPAGTVNQSPRTLVVRGIRIQGAVTTVLAGGPVVYAYSLAYGHTAVSLATTETASFATATTKAPRRIPLGIESFAATAAVGAIGSGVYVPFAAPVVINPGEFVAVTAKNFGTVTTTGVITFLVTFDHYFE